MSTTEKKTKKIPKKFVCELCQVGFISNKSLERHTNGVRHQNKVNRPKLEKKHKCFICNVSTDSASNYKRHMKSAIHHRNVSLTIKVFKITII